MNRFKIYLKNIKGTFDSSKKIFKNLKISNLHQLEMSRMIVFNHRNFIYPRYYRINSKPSQARETRNVIIRPASNLGP